MLKCKRNSEKSKITTNPITGRWWGGVGGWVVTLEKIIKESYCHMPERDLLFVPTSKILVTDYTDYSNEKGAIRIDPFNLYQKMSLI